MFKLLSLTLALCVLCAASPEGNQPKSEENNDVTPVKSIPSPSPSTPPPTETASQESTSATPTEEFNESAEAEAPPASISVLRPSPTSSSSSSATAGQQVATAESLASILFATPIKSASPIQHHILPAETIPLPITISARTGLRTVIAPETITIHQPTIAKIGEVVQQIPTAVSHQSQTIVHNHARVVTPIVAPAVRTFTSQVVRAYHTPIVYAAQAPVVHLVEN